jgi:PAS domain S-box-containing protein
VRQPPLIPGLDRARGAPAPTRQHAAWFLALALAAGGLAHALHDLVPTSHGAALTALFAVGTVLLAGALGLAAHRGARQGGRALQALQAERTLHAQALGSLHQAVVAVDRDFVIRAWNRAAEQMYGYAAAEALGRPAGALLVTELPGGGGYAELRAQLERELAVHTVARRRRRDGSWFEADIAIAALRDEAGQLVGYVGSNRDVTEQRRAEEAIRSAQAQIDLLTSRAPAGLFQLDARGEPVFVNDQFCAMTGLPPEHLHGGGWLRAVHADDRERVRVEWTCAAAEGRTFHSEFRMGEGELATWVVATAKPLEDDAGTPQGVVGALSDITEARAIQARLSQAERMASLGTLASGMAHEINNPLASVISCLGFAAGELSGRPGLEDAGEALADAGEAARRVARIVRDLQAFSELRDEVEPIDLRLAVKGALELVPAQLRRRAQVELDLGPVPPVVASLQQVERVLHHLLANAFQAVPEARAGAGKVRAATATAPDGSALVVIEDDGQGIAPEVLPRIFEPFFTTRAAGDGQGLGLAVCHGLVTSLSGAMEVESEPGRGSTFRVRLPAAGPAQGGPPAQEEGYPGAELPAEPARPVAALVR